MSVRQLLAAAALAAASLPAAADVAGERTDYASPNGLTEHCVRIAPLPGAHYSKHDRKEEADFCDLDLHRLALCPKLWSTSPGTIVYDIGKDASAADIRCSG